MSAFGMKPKFNNRETYLTWRQQWKWLFRKVSDDIRTLKLQVKNANSQDRSVLQKKLHYESIMGYKLMTVLEEAKIRRNKILESIQKLKEQNEKFPINISAREVIFHFNKAHLEFPHIPMWTIKTKGQSYYVEHVNCNSPWSTKETPDNKHTKGSIKIKNVSLTIDENNIAHLDSK